MHGCGRAVPWIAHPVLVSGCTNQCLCPTPSTLVAWSTLRVMVRQMRRHSIPSRLAQATDLWMLIAVVLAAVTHAAWWVLKSRRPSQYTTWAMASQLHRGYKDPDAAGWICWKCGTHNPDDRTRYCRQCRAVKQNENQQWWMEVPDNVRPGDWRCTECNTYNYSSREWCERCSAPRHGHSEVALRAPTVHVPLE